MQVRSGSTTVRVHIRDCLHAPDAVTNLLSVGRLASNGFRCTFDVNRVVITTPERSGRTRELADRMSGSLAFIDVTFVPPSHGPRSSRLLVLGLWNLLHFRVCR